MDDDYEVGYGKPPKANQFKPGQSGNPKGRPKGTRNLKTDFLEELAEKITVIEGGKSKKITKQQGVVKSLLAKAINGDAKATDTFFKQRAQILGLEEQAETAALPPDDQQIIDRYMANHKNIETDPDQEI